MGCILGRRVSWEQERHKINTRHFMEVIGGKWFISINDKNKQNKYLKMY